MSDNRKKYIDRIVIIIFCIALMISYSNCNKIDPSTNNNVPPEVLTTLADHVTIYSGRLNADITNVGLGTTAWFEWGTDSTLSINNQSERFTIPPGPMVLPYPIKVDLIGLRDNTIYYFQAVAIHNGSVVKGGISQFKTLSASWLPVRVAPSILH